MSLILLAACGASSNNNQNQNGLKPSCDTIKTACAAYTANSTNDGHECYTLGNTGTEANCSQQLTKCQNFCNIDDGKDVVSNYSALVYANYSEALTLATALQTKVTALVTSPSPTTMQEAKDAWIASRPVYGQSEAFRFYGGPIDGSNGPEGQINAWPLDEQHIDYIDTNASAGIINGVDTITKSMIAASNGPGEEDIATGYHAIEFLLWGQDVSDDGTPGQRQYTDYLTTGGGTAANQQRRGEYLRLVTELLIDDLTQVKNAWAPSASYRTSFNSAAVRTSLSKIVNGMGSMMKAELSTERMENAYVNKSKNDEHSCFSDNTLADLEANLKGVENVYLGEFGSVAGKGISDLVLSRDSGLDSQIKAHFLTAHDAILGIPAPFDQAILGDESASGRQAVKAAIDACKVIGDDMDEVLSLLGLELIEAP